MRFDFDDDEDDTEDQPEPKKDEPSPKKDEPKPKKGGSSKRFWGRLKLFREDGRPLPWLRHHGLWLLHNCVVHPLMSVGPTSVALELHELTSQWLNHSGALEVGWHDRNFLSKMGYGVAYSRQLKVITPIVKKPVAWFIHNTIGHIAIGLFPTERMFAWHDRTAKAMDVPGWV